jgi:energy-coupling factor transport system ATP-binding protein
MSIQLEHVTYTYGQGTPFEKTALHDVSLTIHEGEFVGIIGHTGSGKSTLVQHLNGLLHPTSGTVTVNGVDLVGKTETVKQTRHKVGMVFQYPEHQLFEETIAKDIAFGPKNLGFDEACARSHEICRLRLRYLCRAVSLPFVGWTNAPCGYRRGYCPRSRLFNS